MIAPSVTSATSKGNKKTYPPSSNQQSAISSQSGGTVGSSDNRNPSQHRVADSTTVSLSSSTEPIMHSRVSSPSKSDQANTTPTVTAPGSPSSHSADRRVVDTTTNRLSSNQLRASSVINLSKSRQMSPDEISVLELGLNFCPSVKEINKEQLADDYFHFIRRLKLREYFSGADDDTNELDDSPTSPDRCASTWKQCNPDFYPEEVKENRSAGLEWFVEQFLSESRHA